ncbi:LOW QUALITY PROTEIN: hypothetical protein V2J09_016352 [Rumex salicifolius]
MEHENDKSTHADGGNEEGDKVDVDGGVTNSTDNLATEEMKAAEEKEVSDKVVWWKLPLDLFKYCAFRVSPVWSLSVAAAFVGFVILGRRLYKMKRKTQGLHLKVIIDDKRVSQFMTHAARLNEAFSLSPHYSSFAAISRGSSMACDEYEISSSSSSSRVIVPSVWLGDMHGIGMYEWRLLVLQCVERIVSPEKKKCGRASHKKMNSVISIRESTILKATCMQKVLKDLQKSYMQSSIKTKDKRIPHEHLHLSISISRGTVGKLYFAY